VKNLYDPAALEEVRGRIARLTPDTPRQWGTMTPAQMAAHCAEFMAMAVGDVRPPRMLIGRLIGPIAKRTWIRRDRRPPRNSPTVPGYAIRDEREFEKERTRLRALVDRFAAAGPAACTTHPHSFFGRLTAVEWSVLMYKHLDHHLRQFGL
jgi:uncharacterized protein DUF1569